jgi:hypothetical protein
MLDEEELKGVPLLVFANKQDVEGAASAAEVSELLGLAGDSTRPWSVRACSALKGEGLNDGLDWCAYCSVFSSSIFNSSNPAICFSPLLSLLGLFLLSKRHSRSANPFHNLVLSRKHSCLHFIVLTPSLMDTIHTLYSFS